MSNLIYILIQCSLIIFLGIFARLAGAFSQNQIQGLGLFLFKICLPCYLFLVAYQNKLILKPYAHILYALLSIYVITWLCIYLYYRQEPFKEIWLRMMGLSINNIGLVVLPISIINQNPVSIQLVYFLSFIIFCINIPSFLIILQLSSQPKASLSKSFIKILQTPMIILPILGIILNSFEIKLPFSIINAVNKIGEPTGFLGLLILGLNIASIKLDKNYVDNDVYYFIVIKHLVSPFLFIIFGHFILDLSAETLFFFLLFGFSAMGLNVYLAASLYKVSQNKFRNILAISTIISAVQMSLIFLFYKG